MSESMTAQAVLEVVEEAERGPLADVDPLVDPHQLDPGSFRVSTQLMQDTVAAVGVSVGDGAYNQEALFANPFKDGREEALVVDAQNRLTYLERTESSDTGWAQTPVTDDSGAAYSVAEVVVARHPSGETWAICSPLDGQKYLFGLRLVLGERTAQGEARCAWTGAVTFDRIPSQHRRSLCVTYSAQDVPLILGTSLTVSGGVSILALTPQLPQSVAAPGDPAWVSTTNSRLLSPGYPLVGGGLVGDTLVTYFLNGQTLIRYDDTSTAQAGPLTVSTSVAQFCGTYYVPPLNQDNPQSDVGCVFVTTKGDLVTSSAIRPSAPPVTSSVPVSGLDFAARTKSWQDADGLLHVFGLNSAGTLQVLHQSSWQTFTGAVDGVRTVHPKWTAATVAGAPEGIGDFDLMDPGDRLVAFDYTGSGKSDHLLAYGPTTPGQPFKFSVLRYGPGGGFTVAYHGIGIPDSVDVPDAVVAFDYTGSGSEDHLLAADLAGGAWTICKGGEIGGAWGLLSVMSSMDGLVADAPFKGGDGIVAFDYTGSGKNDHLLVYRPGAGAAWVLAKAASGAYPFTVVASSTSGLGGFTLANAADRIVGIDYAGTGSSTHLLAYRPGAGMAYIVHPDGKGGFTAVLKSDKGGIGTYDLAVPEDRLVPFDYTGRGFNDHILAYRPGTDPRHGDQTAWVLGRVGTTNTYHPVIQSRYGLGGYAFNSPNDLVTGMDFAGTGALSYLVAYQPGGGKATVMGQRGAGNIAPVYQAPPTAAQTVTVGLHAGVLDFQLDPYPDYKPSQLIRMDGASAAEAYCICTQDVTTSGWQMDRVRRAETPSADDIHIVSHYVANATLLDKLGNPMPGHNVSVSADSLVEVQIGAISYQVGPGRAIPATTDSGGRLVVSIAARGLNPPVVHLNADGLQSGLAIDFAAQVNNFLAGHGSLPSQSGAFTADLLKSASVTPNDPTRRGDPDPLVADWAALEARGLTAQVVVDHCATVYEQAASNAPHGPAIKGFGLSAPISGYVIQTWDADRPAFQPFHTRDEVGAYQAYRGAHASYGGWWDDVAAWASDAWEGVKSGATRVAEVIVHAADEFGAALVEIAIWVGDAVVSLGELVIEAVEQAVQAVEAVFQMIADAVARVVEWLKSLFAFDDIWNTKTALQGMLNQLPAQMKVISAHYGSITTDWFTRQRDVVHMKLAELKGEYKDTRMGDFSNKVPPLNTSDGDLVQPEQFKDDPQANWARNSFMGDSTSALLSAALRATDGPDEILAAFTDVFNVMTGGSPSPMDRFSDAANSFGDAVLLLLGADSSGGAALSKIIDSIDEIADAVLIFLDQVVQKLFALIDAVADGFDALLNTPFSVGPLDALWEWFMAAAGHSGEPLTMSNLFCLIAAFFVTVVYKLIMGVDNPPFAFGLFPAVPGLDGAPLAVGGVPHFPDGGLCYMSNIAANIITAIPFNILEIFTNFHGDNEAANLFLLFCGFLSFQALSMPFTFTPVPFSSWWTPWLVWLAASVIGLGTLKFGEVVDKKAGNTLIKQWGALGGIISLTLGLTALTLSVIAWGNEDDPPYVLAAAITGCLSTITGIAVPIAKKFPAEKQIILGVKSVLDGLGNAASGILGLVYNCIAVDGKVVLSSSTGTDPQGVVARYAPLPDATIGIYYEVQLQTTGKYTPFSYALGWGGPNFTIDATNKLPEGLGWHTVTDENGLQQFVISGVPSNPRQSAVVFGVWATDSNKYPPFNSPLECAIDIGKTTVGGISPHAGGGQSAEISAQYATRLAVAVTDLSGKPLPKAGVTFTAPGTGASGTFPDGSLTATVAADETGIATAPDFVANGVKGQFTITAAVPGVSTASTTLTLTNTGTTVTAVAATLGDNQSTYSGQLFSDPLQATISISAGGSTAPRKVVFSCSSADDGHFVAGGQSVTVMTDANGAAKAGGFWAGTVPAGNPNRAVTITAIMPGVDPQAAFHLTIKPLE